MKLTHLGHSCVLIEIAGKRILVDPGNFSDNWHGLTGLDAVLVTHQHTDHIDPENLPKLLAANPNAQIAVEKSVLEHFDLPANTRGLTAGETVEIGAVKVETVGGNHAIIHADIPRVHNVGMLFKAPEEPVIFHPGDSLETTPRGVDIVLIPVMAPWCATKEVIDFTRAVGASKGLLIHDRLLNERGYQMIRGHIARLGGTELIDQRAQ